MKKGKNIFWGLIIIAVGIIFLGNNVNWWNVDIFFDGWWSLFIIIPSIYGLFNKDSLSSSVVTLALGILLLLAAQDVIDWNMIWKILVPIIIIIVGLSIIFKSTKTKKINKENAKSYTAVFSGVDEIITELNYDFKVVSIFGGVDLDLRKAKVKKDITIECTSIFGGIEIRMPDDIKIVLNGVPIFGGVDNRYNESKEAKVTVYINYTTIFGGVDIL